MGDLKPPRHTPTLHTLLEFCGLVNCLIIDEDGVYDARLPNDRLLLGMKGTMSEMELSLFRQRVSEARILKAKRGELFATIAVGYRKVAHEDQIEKEPDQRVQQAITLVFKKFTELQSVRQVHRWLRRRPSRCQTPHTVRRVATSCGNCRFIRPSMV